jgi:hypothetical protein
MTHLVSDDVCVICGNLLVPPMPPGSRTAPWEPDYVCLHCGRAYHWIGNPPQLAPVEPPRRAER